MKTLKSVCESISPKLKDQLMAFINSDAITDDIAHKMLHAAIGENILEDFKNIMISKNIGECTTGVRHIVQDYGQMIDVLNVLNDPSKQISGDDIFRENNIYNLLYITGLNRNMLTEIANLVIPNKKGINRGKYEILLTLFIKDIVIVNVGDLAFKTGYGECHLEVKCDDARICNQKTPNFELAENFLRDLVGNDPYFKKKNLLGSQRNVMETCKQIQDFHPKLDVFNVLVRTLNAQYSGLDESPEKILGNKYEKIRKAVYKNDKDIDTKQFVRLMMAIQLRGYLRGDVFDELMLVDGKSGDYVIVGTDEIESLDTFDNKHIKVATMGGRTTGAYRESFCQISYM